MLRHWFGKDCPIGTKINDNKRIFEEERQLLFHCYSISLIDFRQQKHFVFFSSIKIIMIINNMHQEYFFIPIRSKSNTIKWAKRNSTFDLKFIVNINKKLPWHPQGQCGHFLQPQKCVLNAGRLETDDLLNRLRQMESNRCVLAHISRIRQNKQTKTA